MSVSKNLLSVIITTYNRVESLKKAIDKVCEQTYKEIEIIVSDDCSTDGTAGIADLYPQVRYIKTPSNLGYTKNSRYALSFAKGEYIIFLSDDDELYDIRFFEEAINALQQGTVDAVIAQIAIRTCTDFVVHHYPFKPLYRADELFEWWLDVRSHFTDYFSLSSMVLRKDILERIDPFVSIFEDSSSVDASIIFKYIACSNEIAVLDMVGYVWNFPEHDTLSNADRNDLVKQAKYNLAFVFDMDEFLKKETLNPDLVKVIKQALNQRVEWVFDAILSEKERLKNKDNFQKLLLRVDREEDIYIYGRGWTGLSLAHFLKEQGAKVKSFVDDYKTTFEDTISFDEFKERSGKKQVVLTSYKYKDLYRLSKKCFTCKEIEVYDLLGE